ncbi:MAG TPA: hypothetical protein VFZ42_09270 [Chitinophagaceae bacterium]
MSKPIRTYKDMQEEKERLELQLKNQKQLIMGSASALKDEFKPAFSAISFLGSLVKRDSTNPVLGTAANSIIDLVLKRVVLGRAGWIARTLIPLMVKNMSSHYIADHEDDIFKKLFRFFGLGKKKKRGNKQPEQTNGQVIID